MLSRTRCTTTTTKLLDVLLLLTYLHLHRVLDVIPDVRSAAYVVTVEKGGGGLAVLCLGGGAFLPVQKGGGGLAVLCLGGGGLFSL